MLNVTETGRDSNLPPVLLAHGLFGSGKNLGGIARRLAEDRRVLSVDMRNHGDSAWTESHSYDDLAGDLARVIADHGGQMDVVGHSMGGKAAMWLALTRPQHVNRLVVLDIAPVTYDHDQHGPLEAARGLDVRGVSLRSEADRRLSETIAEPGVRAFLLQSLDLKAEPPRWKINLDLLAGEMDRLTGFPATEGRHFDGPALFLAGALSNYVLPEHEASIHAAFPQAQIRRIDGTGHWLHAEKPAEVASAVAGFLT